VLGMSHLSIHVITVGSLDATECADSGRCKEDTLHRPAQSEQG
jgi:hypothetical protein